MNPMIRLIAAIAVITFILYACLGHNGGLLLSNGLATLGVLMIGFGLTKMYMESQAKEAKPVRVADNHSDQP